MILKGSQRGGARQLALHLLKTTENEHVELHEVRGFMAEDVLGALREAEAVSKGTRCKQPLFSVSLNPPEHATARIGDFEQAIEAIEERNGLSGQPRVVVFHEKEGRRHCHAVWSRIDAETMTARPLPFFKTRLREISKELYLEHGWQMPRGFVDSKARDPKNFSLAEWQQAKRIGKHAGELKGMIQECWTASDSKAAFSKALEERGLYLAKGDRRGHVAVTFEGEVISIPRALGKKSKEVTSRLGQPDLSPSVKDTRERIGNDLMPRMKDHLAAAREQTRRELSPLDQKRRAMREHHAAEREKLDEGQKARAESEQRERMQRVRKGFMGLWDKLTGTYAKTRKQNEMEAVFALERDREQRHQLLQAQLAERSNLQNNIREARQRHAAALRALHHDLTNYRLMRRGEEPKPRTAFERLEAMRRGDGRSSSADRLERLKQDRSRSPDTPEPER